MRNPSAKDRIIVSIDVDEISEARELIDDIGHEVGMLKFGLQLGTSAGWGQVMQALRDTAPNTGVFADTKFMDIPNTMYGAARSIQRHRPAIFNVYAGNSLEALSRTVEGAQSAVDDYPEVNEKSLIIGVTVLTSINDEESQSIFGAKAAEKVLEFGDRAAQAGLDGLVCSPQEVAALRSRDTTKNMVLVTPSIRPEWAATNDQARPTTPRQAVDMGSDYLVIGRPITAPPNGMSRKEAVQKIIEELES